MSEHKYIWLQPECCADPDEGRHWCQDPDPVDCDDGKPWVKYILASEYESLERQLADVRGELAQTKADADGYRTRAEMTQAGFDAVSDELTTLRQSLQRADVEAATLCQKGQNRHGVDCGYFSQKLALVLRDLRYYTREELSLELERLSKTALPASDVDKPEGDTNA